MSQQVDPRFGHVTLHDDAGHYAFIEDCGDTCRLNRAPGYYHSDPYTEEQAREIGAALIGWAGRKRLARNLRTTP